ncbi:MAG: glycosyltransferase [Afipia sp.]|nr:MAG: glycosyltransferase [Afipia sp.]
MSTDHQKYSTENQSDAIKQYAQARGIEIVKTYADAGKSGLKIEGRDALQQLIEDVKSGSGIGFDDLDSTSLSVEFIGEISDHEKSDFLSGALGLLLPIDWPEPFGLVMIEAMACGTPVVAFNRGSVPEIIDEGLTGFIVEDVISAAGVVNRLPQLDRTAIRKQFETRFTARRMALDYLAAYRSLTEAQAPRIKLVSSAE